MRHGHLRELPFAFGRHGARTQRLLLGTLRCRRRLVFGRHGRRELDAQVGNGCAQLVDQCIEFGLLGGGGQLGVRHFHRQCGDC